MGKDGPKSFDPQGASQMNRWKRPLTIMTCLLSLILGAGAAPAFSQTARIQSITGNGKVKIQRQNRTNWDLASPGKDFKDGDQIFPDSGMKVLVQEGIN